MIFPPIRPTSAFWGRITEFKFPPLELFLEQVHEPDHITKDVSPDNSEQGRFSRSRYRHQWTYGSLQSQWLFGPYEKCLGDAKLETTIFGYPVDHLDDGTKVVFLFPHVERDGKWECITNWNEGVSYTSEALDATFFSAMAGGVRCIHSMYQFMGPDVPAPVEITYNQNSYWGPPVLLFDEDSRIVSAGCMKKEDQIPTKSVRERVVFDPKSYTETGRWSSTEYQYLYAENDYESLRRVG